MTEVMNGMLTSPLADRYRQTIVATHRGTGRLQRLVVFAQALLVLIWWSASGRGRIVHVHATVRGSMYRKSVCVLLAAAMQRRVILHMHSGPGDIGTFRARLGPVRLFFIRRAFRRADAVISVSSASAAALADAFGAAGAVVVPNAAPAVGDPRRAPNRDALPTVVYLGGFANPVKGGQVLLEALARPEAAAMRVVLAGPGELPAAGRWLVDSGDDVTWRGWLDAGERNRLLRDADIFVLPSTSEGLPMALLEALASGLAIVATDVGGVPDVVEPDRDALVVPAADPSALGVALDRVARDAELRESLAASAREQAGRLGPAAVADRIDALYRSLS
jgi:glycosyltransferase involved in cell wall biosynthesis